MANPGRNIITVLIKTFERKRSLIRLLESLQQRDPTLPILIADDSKQSYKEEILARFPGLSIQYYKLPFDTGLAAGRNFLLQKVNTPFFLLCDDDFVLDQEADTAKVVDIMETEELDIAGGAFLNYTVINSMRGLVKTVLTPHASFRLVTGKPVISRYAGSFVINKKSCALMISNQQQQDLVYRCDLVNNFFVARTSDILKMGGWDENFKVGEHEEFFYRAKLQGLKVAFIEGFATRHYPKSTTAYLRFRQRSYSFKKKFLEKFGFTEYKEVNADTGNILFYCQDDGLN